MLIRLAHSAEQRQLEDLQRRASLALGTYNRQLEAHPEAIHLPARQIALGEVLVAEIDGEIAGFAVVLDDDGQAALDGLFVEPPRWRQGVGSALVTAAVQLARDRGLTLMTVVAEPAARSFYEKCGFTVEGDEQTRFGPALRMSR
jgi:GNAT superfamily N-acetyltransferase